MQLTDEELAAVPVDIVTEAEWAALVDHMLTELGVSFDELAAQARASDFMSEDARRVWFAIKPI
jgi:hypothetical protein